MAVTCAQCAARAAEIKRAEARHFRASELFRVGKPAPELDRFGHHVYHATNGIVTLCAAQRQQPPGYYQAT